MNSVNPAKRSARLAGKRRPAVSVALGGGGGYTSTTDCGENRWLKNERG